MTNFEGAEGQARLRSRRYMNFSLYPLPSSLLLGLAQNVVLTPVPSPAIVVRRSRSTSDSPRHVIFDDTVEGP